MTLFLHFLSYGFGYGLRPKAEVCHGQTIGYGRRWKLRLRSNTGDSCSKVSSPKHFPLKYRKIVNSCELFQLHCANLVKYVRTNDCIMWWIVRTHFRLGYFSNLYFTLMINSLYLEKCLCVKNMLLQKRLHPFVDCLEGFCKSFDSVLHKKSYFFWYNGLANISLKYSKNGILLPKLFWRTVIKNCSSDREKLLIFEAEGREFAKILRSIEQFIQTVKVQNKSW